MYLRMRRMIIKWFVNIEGSEILFIFIVKRKEDVFWG